VTSDSWWWKANLGLGTQGLSWVQSGVQHGVQHGTKARTKNQQNQQNQQHPQPWTCQVGAKPNDPRGFWISSLSCRYHSAMSCENSGPSLGFSHFLEMQPVDGEFPPVISQDAVSTPGKTDSTTPKL